MSVGKPPVVVVGAGIVGLSTALYLALAGVPVVLVDRDPPGQGCSAGNAGMLGSNSCIPTALPGVLRQVPKMLRGPGGALGLRARDLPRLAPWLVRFVRAGRPARVEAIADALNRLQRELMPAYEVLLDAADARHLVRATGKLHVAESETAWQAGAYGRTLQRQRGVALEEIDGTEARALQPRLGPRVHRATWYPGIAHSLDPRALIEAFARRFLAAGGTLRREAVTHLDCAAAGGQVVTATGPIAFSRVVLAAGVWSRDLARPLGVRVPLEGQRGYHVMIPDSGGSAPIPVKSDDRKIIVTPMAEGLRITGVAEFATPDAPPSPGRHAALAEHARALMPELADTWHDPWLGSRPCTPDSLPVLDRAPGRRDVFLAFGHGHLGLGLGAISGRLMRDLVLGQPTPIDLTPYRADRF